MSAVMPKRIQRKRVKGWRMPDGAISVSRPSQWGNPFKIGTAAPGVFKVNAKNCLRLFEAYARGKLEMQPDWLEPLAGKDLACWCKEGEPCHADILLKLANK